MALLMKGVKNASRKFQTQLEAVDKLPCFARVRVGNVSPIKIQTPLQNVNRKAPPDYASTYGAQVIA
jgi:hypothetical protein